MLGEVNRFSKEIILTGPSDRRAVITYIDNVFISCKYSVNAMTYTLDDWLFLNEVSERIKSEEKFLDKVKKDLK